MHDVYKVIHDFQIMTLVDKIVGEPTGVMLGVTRSRVTTESLRSTVNLANPAPTARPARRPTVPTTCRCRTPTASPARA